MKDGKPTKQNSGWFILFAVFFTIAIFILFLLQATSPSSSQTNPSTVVATSTGSNVSSGSSSNKLLVYKKEKVEKPHLNTLTQDWLKRFFESVSENVGNGLVVRGQTVKGVQVGKSFLIYNVKLTSKNNGFLLHITMEPPELKIQWENEIYGQFYPLLNPYIHVMDLIYTWTWTGQPTFTLQLEQMDVQTVPWKSNRYHNDYRDIKGSPLYKVPVPEPLDLSKEEITEFLKSTGIFQTLTVVQTDLEVSDVQGSTV